MNILFDKGTPVPLRFYLDRHFIKTAYEQGWSDIKNGELFNNAEQAGFNLLITPDQNLQYQRNLNNRKLSIIVQKSISWPRIKLLIEEIKKLSILSNQEIMVRY